MPKHGIKIVTQQTGLSPHVLRVWEKRYQAVTPMRTDTNRRLYTDSELQRLKALAILTGLGYAIGQIARLSCSELQVLLRKHDNSINDRSEAPATDLGDEQEKGFISRAIQATKEMDQAKLETIFDEASIAFGYSGLLERVMVPFIKLVGQLWQEGHISSSDEHAASCAIREYLAHTTRPFTSSTSSPSLIVTTPSGQLHEIGAVIAASLARKAGWNVTYLGASLPAEEIASAAIKRQAKAVALSIVYPVDDPHLLGELGRLRRHLPNTPIIVGGQGAAALAPQLSEFKMKHLSSIREFNTCLCKIRSCSF
ncbi:B12 binding domain-containing protein [Rubritalea squalenifaciens DSM 18772]|uniref:B12 binding domain-containing protein n=1 Tax=Rubritalea squalenifaciens DSM 18772 TaxID=1123071 RepID=A0A1M6P3L8_9BACT|nr:cobalamin-dependent protein [Rubritalea squalenifaciens]SHK02493.1 B12 binding domain-containing protein [Rubritalea squalenifaciens DSM 18772]